jgi:hypothetical protein
MITALETLWTLFSHDVPRVHRPAGHGRPIPPSGSMNGGSTRDSTAISQDKHQNSVPGADLKAQL